MKTAFLIAAPTSGSGKTTIARGLMALFTQKGFKVQPFKCGPDYIDTKFHEAVCRRPSVNLDTFMATPEHVRELFACYGADADICIVEGMMGMFDGYDRDCGSSAEIARVLDIPVVLVVNARSAAYSMAPLLQGFIRFREDVKVAGVIFNQVGSQKHCDMLQQACDDLGIPCFGYLPKSVSLKQNSRYLGLDFSKGTEGKHLVELIAENIDWEGLLHLTARVPLSVGQSKAVRQTGLPCVNVCVARNAESFSFLYQETIDVLRGTRRSAEGRLLPQGRKNEERGTRNEEGGRRNEEGGTRIEFFDPERDVPCLDDVDLLYLPGGYPEKHLEALVSNEACRQAIKDYAERGGRVVAECGGMMYLCKEIVTDQQSTVNCQLSTVNYPMCGVLPYSITARQADRRLSLGYRRFVLDGREYRGHEFHYTRFLGETPPSVCQVFNAKGEPVDIPVFKYKNVLASYTHLYSIDY